MTLGVFMTMHPILQALTLPPKLWRRSEMLTLHCPIPRYTGVYAWYFRDLPVPTENCHTCEDAALLYIGVAPSCAESSATLQSRIRTHLRRDASWSTLRLTLGCLLSELLSLRLRYTGSTARLTFGLEGEDRLSAWLEEHASLVWVESIDPWRFEQPLIEQLLPPLNLTHNERHPFYTDLSRLRETHRQRARNPDAQLISATDRRKRA